MKVILSENCLSLTGMLGDCGYYLRKKDGGYISQRSAHGAPPDGHWRFIVLCAELAQNGLHITDIRVKQTEVSSALREYGYYGYLWQLRYPKCLNAADVLKLSSSITSKSDLDIKKC